MTRKRDTEAERISSLMETCMKVNMYQENVRELVHMSGRVNWQKTIISNGIAGHRYQGEFQANLRHGNGLFIYLLTLCTGNANT